MNEKDIEMLLTLYTEKNVTRTSEKLFMTQPALTKRIKKLEAEFNTSLIIRSTKGVIFTHQGEKLISHLKALKIHFQNIKDDIMSTLDEVQGSLRLGVSSVFAHYELPILLKGYIEKYPKVELSIQTDHSSKIYNLLQSNEISAGIIRGDYTTWTDNKKLLSTEPICLASNKQISFEELLNSTYITFKAASDLQHQLNQWWSEKNFCPPKGIITTNSIETCVELIKNGIGWSILPYSSLKKYDGYKEKLSWQDGTPLYRNTWIYYKEEYLQLPTVSTFINHIQEHAFNDTIYVD